ncbi:MAG: T9SS type A sorting domain-containing protein [Ignavibacteria bacterium]|nr:T9SS type A sorting domain-containing protein [Ignavibacteria bacterium]
MKKVLTAVLILLVSVSFTFAQDKKIANPSIEDGNVKSPSKVIYGYIPANLLETYPGSIPNTSNFCDYMTNGSSLNQLWVLGDTIIVAYFASDSNDALGATTRIAYYLYSVNNGANWSDPIQLQALPDRSAYPDLYIYLASGDRNVVISGRKYTGSSSRGGAWAETLLGLGSFLSSNVPEPGRDFFGAFLNGNIYAGMYSSPDAGSNDSLFFVKYDVSSNSYSNKTQIAVAPTNIYQNVRYRFTADQTGNNLFGMWWDNTTAAYSVRYVTSTNGGTSFSSPQALQTAFTLNGVINGDTCSPWFGYDALYKPGTTQWFATWSTLFPTATGQTGGYAQGDKILIASPGLNGGVPVEVAGKINMEILSNPTLFNGYFGVSVGVTPVSHPTIAFSSDGLRLVCVFSAFQPYDTLDTYNFNDIYVTYSDNGGLNWAIPVNMTNTPDWDELYPTLSETGNTLNSFKVKFIATRGPGCSFFSNNAPVYRVYQVLRTFNPENVGIQNISTEIPEGIALYQNYPNPFNPVTKIKFAIPQGLKNNLVTLKVYDILGKEISTIVNQNLTPGTYEADFDGGKISSGVYFYKLTAGNFTETKRMMLVK